MESRYEKCQSGAKISRKGLLKVLHLFCTKRGKILAECGIDVAIPTSSTQEGKVCAALSPKGGSGRTNSWSNSAAVPLPAPFGPGCRHVFDLFAEWRLQPWPPSCWHCSVAQEGLQSSACHRRCAVLLTDRRGKGSCVCSQWKTASSRGLRGSYRIYRRFWWRSWIGMFIALEESNLRLLIKDRGTQSYLTKEVIKLLTKSLTKATEARSLNDFQKLFPKWRL